MAPPTFLSLAPELRNYFYQLCSRDEDNTIKIFQTKEKGDTRGAVHYSKSPYLQLLLTSRQIHNEARIMIKPTELVEIGILSEQWPYGLRGLPKPATTSSLQFRRLDVDCGMPNVETVKVRNMNLKIKARDWPANDVSNEELVSLLLAKASLRSLPVFNNGHCEFKIRCLADEGHPELAARMQTRLRYLDVQASFNQVGTGHTIECMTRHQRKIKIVIYVNFDNDEPTAITRKLCFCDVCVASKVQSQMAADNEAELVRAMEQANLAESI